MTHDPPPSPPALFDRSHWPLLLVLACVVVVYLQTLGFSFVEWDDPIHVTRNPLLLQSAQTPWIDLFKTPHLGYPMPVTLFSYWLEIQLFGIKSATPFHATNLLLHLANTALVFWIARTLSLRTLGAICAALLFALHPSASEPVSWVTGRKDLLCAFFGLSALLWTLRRPFSLRDAPSYAAPVLFLLASFSKPTILCLTPFVFLWRFAFERGSLLKSIETTVPFALVSAIVFPIAFLGQKANSSIRADQSLLELLREAWYALGFHSKLLVLVEEPCVKHFPPEWPPHFDPFTDLLPLALLALFGLLLALLPKTSRPVALLALAFSALSYAPSSNLIPLTRYIADVYIYLPSIGVALFLGVCFDALHTSLNDRTRLQPWLVVSLVVVALGFSARSYNASSAWENSVTLWQRGFQQYPNDHRMCRNLGNALAQRNEPQKALALYNACAERFGSAPFEKNQAIMLYRLGQHQEALQRFEALRTKRPDDPSIERYIRAIKGQLVEPFGTRRVRP